MDMDVLLSRGTRDTTELRGQCPVEIVAVLDAVCFSRGLDRTALVNEILGAWMKQKVHESQSVTRVLRGNPVLEEAAGA